MIHCYFNFWYGTISLCLVLFIILLIFLYVYKARPTLNIGVKVSVNAQILSLIFFSRSASRFAARIEYTQM